MSMTHSRTGVTSDAQTRAVARLPVKSHSPRRFFSNQSYRYVYPLLQRGLPRDRAAGVSSLNVPSQIEGERNGNAPLGRMSHLFYH